MENDSSHLVSVVMATFNDDPTVLENAINSILNQSYKNLELIILDDSTAVSTIKCIDKFSDDKRVNIIRKDNKMHLSGARNTGLQNAKGRYIAIMDGDDISLPHRLLHQVKYLEDNPQCCVLGGQMYIIDESGKVISERHYPLMGLRLKMFATVRNPVAHPAVMFRRELYEEGFIYDEKLEMSEDLDLWLRVMNANYEIRNLDEYLICYRVGNNFTAKRTSKKQKKYMADVRMKNWSFAHPLFSTASLLAGLLFTLIPNSVLSGIYKKENKRSLGEE